MTAVLVMQLRDAGALSLTDPLERHLPGTAYGDRTLGELLSHSAGLPAEPPGAWWERVDGGGLEQLRAGLDRLLASEAPFAPGETYHYSNLAYGLLGAVVAQVGGGSWWEQLGERVLTPLGMLRTSYDPFDPHAQGWSTDPWTGQPAREPHTDTGAMAPAGQLWSTVMDLSTLADVLIGGHRGVLRPETLDEMCTPRSGTARDGLALAYGLGVRLFPGGSGTLVGHTGSMPGFQAALRGRPGAPRGGRGPRQQHHRARLGRPVPRPARPARAQRATRAAGLVTPARAARGGEPGAGRVALGQHRAELHLGRPRRGGHPRRRRPRSGALRPLAARRRPRSSGVAGHHHGEQLQHHRSRLRGRAPGQLDLRLHPQPLRPPSPDPRRAAGPGESPGGPGSATGPR